MKNRDYFTRPRQSGGRTSHDYGHTHLRHDHPETTPMWVLGVFGVILVLGWVFL